MPALEPYMPQILPHLDDIMPKIDIIVPQLDYLIPHLDVLVPNMKETVPYVAQALSQLFTITFCMKVHTCTCTRIACTLSTCTFMRMQGRTCTRAFTSALNTHTQSYAQTVLTR